MRHKKDHIGKLYDAAIEYIESESGKVIVIGGIEIQHFPEDGKYNFRLAIKFTGRKPEKP